MKWYVYREGNQIKVAHIDQAGAKLLYEKGYELFTRPLGSKEEADIEAAAWKKRISSP